ncbi:hypothetical protein ABCR94_17560 [Streptomyces sp. 21So2-11]|uniref:hypothetical protein n=1 Tax=Streptomyces sp. 21So2-11 TaxID=3144408 RepID=UPI00321AF265
MTHATAPYAPDAHLGTRLARELLGVPDPYTHLTTARLWGGDRMGKLTGLVLELINEVDALDQDAETAHRTLAATVTAGRRHTDGPYADAVSARTHALRLEEACAARDRTATFLRRLIISYRTAATPA